MPLLALKVDVDTYRGTCEGVPALIDLLVRHGANATFLFSLGPDHTGRAIRRVFRPGFLQKVSRTSVVEHYGIKTLLYGTLLPGPDIGRKCAPIMQKVRDAGFEVGVHTWDHIRWQDNVTRRDEGWTRSEMLCARDRFMEIYGVQPRMHGAAGWQMNEFAYAIERELGFAYASDGRAGAPFQPVDTTGKEIGVPQIPTTLPTLDELIGVDQLHEGNVHEHLLGLTAVPPAHAHVYTLHAELEGMRMLRVFDRLLTEWRRQGYDLVACDTVYALLDQAALPRRRPAMAEIPGRSGLVAT